MPENLLDAGLSGATGGGADAPAADAGDRPARPAGLPDKFWDDRSGQVRLDALIKSYCRATGKEERLARFDLSVIVSASQDAERRHRSCRDGFSICRVGDNLSVTFG